MASAFSAPNNNSRLIVSNSFFYNNGNGSTGGAIRIRPTGGATTAVIDRSVLSRGTFGAAIDTSAGAAGVNLTVRQSAVSDNTQTGVIAVGAGNGAGIMVDHSSVTNNSANGL